MTSNALTATNRYGALAAEIYDIDKPIGRLPDTRFHLDRLKGFGRPILQPACGTGRTLIPLLIAGLDATGFDQSPDMLDRCKAELARRGIACRVDQQRLEDFHYPHDFGAILMPVGTFCLLDTLDLAKAVLRRFFQALEPGGLLVIDVQGLAALADDRPDRRQWFADNGDLLTLEGARVRTDWLAQRAESRLRYERWRDNRLIETHLEPMALRYWGLREFELELKAAGFGEVTVTGGYDRSREPQAADWVLTFEALKP
jgi:SAM-dependent methyltransferase